MAAWCCVGEAMHGPDWFSSLAPILHRPRRVRDPRGHPASGWRFAVAIACAWTGLSVSALQGANATYRTEHFTFTLYDGLAADFAVPIARAAEDNYRRVLDDFGVTSSPQVPVRIYGSRAHFYDVMEDVTGARDFFDAFAWCGQIYIDATASLNFPVNIVHEFTHLATDLFHPAGLRARWLAEAIAQFEAGSFYHPGQMAYLRDGQAPPTLAQLDAVSSTSRQIYDLGYVLTEFIITTWGRPRLLDLITADGNLTSALGVTPAAFEAQFADWLQETYFVQPDEVFLADTAELRARSVLKPVLDPASWTLQLTAGGQGTMTREGDVLVFRTIATTGTSWHVQAYQTGIDFGEGASYVVRFQIRSPDQAFVQLLATIDQPGYTGVGLGQGFSAGPEFAEQTVMFKAKHVVPGNNRFTLVLGFNPGTVIVKEIVVARMMPPPPPVVTRPPADMTVRAGDDGFFSVLVNDPGASYQWFRDGIALPGATAPSLLVSGVTAADAGAYTVRVTNASGTAESAAGRLVVATGGSARLVNLSVRAFVGTGDNIMIPGFVVGSPGGSAQLLVRAVGPRLADFDVTGLLPDPTLALVPPGGSTPLAANDDWADFPDQAALEAAHLQVGAFPLTGSATEAAMLISLPAGAYTVPVADAGTDTGVALAELYEVSDPGGEHGAQLVNLSARAQVQDDPGVLIGGFVIAGDVAITLLVRAVGPGLESSDVTGVLRDPTLVVYRSLPGGGSEEIARNNDWGDSASPAALVEATTSTHAFVLADGSTDAAMLLALNPGAYTVVVSGADGGTGVALVELYRVGGD